MSQLPLPADLRADLQRVDSIVRQRIEARTAVLRVAGPRILATGASRLRASLVLLAARLGRYDSDQVVHAAAAVELIHGAVLVHDDLIDAADRRLGTVGSHSGWNGDVNLMVGDYLFALASAEMALAPDPRVISFYARSVMAISEGQLAPVSRAAPLHVALDQYLFTAGATSASLIEAACKAGMVCGSGTDEQIEALGRFGYELGLALRIAEDVADVAGPAPGARIGAGIITLPLIFAVDGGAPGLAQLASQRPLSEPQLRQAIEELRRTGAIDRARAEAADRVERALGALSAFRSDAARHDLEAFARAAAALSS